jgi:NADPH-dependent curcumin reductase CurA
LSFPAIQGSNKQLTMSKVPKGYPVLGKTTVFDASQKIDLENVPLNGGFLLKTLALSIDPFMRGKSELGPPSKLFPT